MGKTKPIDASNVEAYTISSKPGSLVEYLRLTAPRDAKGDGHIHRKACELIRVDPSNIGLDARIEIFEERLFINSKGRKLCCPDFIAFDRATYWVIEVAGLGTNLSTQLENASKIIEINFGMRPRLIGVHYSGEPPAIKLQCYEKAN